MDVYQAIENYLSRGRRGTLATIIRKLGAAPREEGAKMFIGDDGAFFGTVGGGCVEAEVWQEAKKVTGDQNAKILHYRMDGTVVEDEGMICGGNVDIFLEPVYERYRDLYSEVRALEKKGKSALIITRYAEGFFFKSLIMEDGSAIGDEADPNIGERFHSLLTGRKPVITDGEIIEPVLSASFLYLFGAGHVSQYVSKIAAIVDFNVVVVDDRDDFANRERFPEAQEIIVNDFATVFDRIRFFGNEYVAILTRGHKHDATVLEEVLKRPTRYVGMIGSKRKTRLIIDHLKKKGFGEDLLKSVHAPIGIAIESETPQEIAVSIVAELIKTKRKV
jgi:xanthine dehydrogenase accessory factor